MKATNEKLRKRHPAGTSDATRKVVGNRAGGMPAARPLTEYAVQFKDGTRMKLYAPTELRDQVVKAKGFSIVERGSRFLVTSYESKADRRKPAASIKTPSIPHDERASHQILTMATKLTGSKAKAQDWYRTFPIPAFGDLTAEFLVDHGRAKEVREYLNAVVLGEFA